MRNVDQYASNQQYLQKTEWVYRHIDRFFRNEAFKKERRQSLIELFQSQHKKLIKLKERKEVDSFKQKLNRKLLKLIRNEQAEENLNNLVSYKTKKYLDVQYDLESLVENRNRRNYNVEMD